ncbi:hypothetical protein SAMN05444166_3904 [Singulisphaera sp. GP187]|nr:hypothetical protein SAMN05444166_3904 [Singulisphaera sp. GP187]
MPWLCRGSPLRPRECFLRSLSKEESSIGFGEEYRRAPLTMIHPFSGCHAVPYLSRDSKLGRAIATRSLSATCSFDTYLFVTANPMIRSRLISDATCRLNCRPSVSAITHSQAKGSKFT